jgi:hypothetical protein
MPFQQSRALCKSEPSPFGVSGITLLKQADPLHSSCWKQSEYLDKSTNSTQNSCQFEPDVISRINLTETNAVQQTVVGILPTDSSNNIK